MADGVPVPVMLKERGVPECTVIVNPSPGGRLGGPELEVVAVFGVRLGIGGAPIGNVVFTAGHPEEASRRTGH